MTCMYLTCMYACSATIAPRASIPPPQTLSKTNKWLDTDVYTIY